MFLATFARFVAGAVILLMRFVATRVAYAHTFACTFARGMASCTACVANSVRTRASLLAMPRLRAQRTIAVAPRVACSVRFRSTVGTNHRVCDPIVIRFRSLLIRFLYAAALLGPPLPGPYLLTQRPCLDLRCQALTYVLTYVAATVARCFGSSDLLFCFCNPNSWPNFKFWLN